MDGIPIANFILDMLSRGPQHDDGCLVPKDVEMRIRSARARHIWREQYRAERIKAKQTREMSK